MCRINCLLLRVLHAHRILERNSVDEGHMVPRGADSTPVTRGVIGGRRALADVDVAHQRLKHARLVYRSEESFYLLGVDLLTILRAALRVTNVGEGACATLS
jgi:hypothetical protein